MVARQSVGIRERVAGGRATAKVAAFYKAVGAVGALIYNGAIGESDRALFLFIA